MLLIFIDNINCFVSKNKLIVKTKDGSDFWTNDDWVADWNLFFNDNSGIYLDTKPVTGVETPLQIESVKIENIPTYFYTEVTIFLFFENNFLKLLTKSFQNGNTNEVDLSIM